MLSKLKTFAALCGAFFIALFWAWWTGRKDGIKHIEGEQQGKRDALQDEYDQIDAGPVDVDGSYDRLRRFSDRR